MGEGAEERCKVVFLREQALLQSYFSSQVTADQLIRNNVNETECCHECCTTRLARLRAARHEQVRTAKSRRRHRCRTLPRATRAARTSLTRHAGEVFYAAADTTRAEECFYARRPTGRSYHGGKFLLQLSLCDFRP